MDIPVIDWSRFTSGDDPAGVVADIGQACRETGFFVITGHGISQDLITNVRRANVDQIGLGGG